MLNKTLDTAQRLHQRQVAVKNVKEEVSHFISQN